MVVGRGDTPTIYMGPGSESHTPDHTQVQRPVFKKLKKRGASFIDDEAGCGNDPDPNTDEDMDELFAESQSDENEETDGESDIDMNQPDGAAGPDLSDTERELMYDSNQNSHFLPLNTPNVQRYINQANTYREQFVREGNQIGVERIDRQLRTNIEENRYNLPPFQISPQNRSGAPIAKKARLNTPNEGSLAESADTDADSDFESLHGLRPLFSHVTAEQFENTVGLTWRNWWTDFRIPRDNPDNLPITHQISRPRIKGMVNLSIPANLWDAVNRVYSRLVTQFKNNDGYMSVHQKVRRGSADVGNCFFIDLEWSSEHLHNFPYTNEEAAFKFAEYRDQVIMVARAKIEQYGIGALSYCVISQRVPNKIHLHFPETSIDVTSMREFLLMIQKDLELNYKNKYFPWYVPPKSKKKDDPPPRFPPHVISPIDAGAANNGLRMIGSSKGEMHNAVATKVRAEVAPHQRSSNRPKDVSKKEWDSILHRRMFPDEQRYPMKNYYEVLNHEGSFSPDLIRQTSIHTTQPPNIFLPRARRATSAPDADDYDPHINVILMQSGEMKKEVHDICCEFNNNYGYELLSGIHSIKTNNEVNSENLHTAPGRRFVWLEPQVCPFVGKYHTRTEERNTPTLRLVINSQQTHLRCYACDQKNRNEESTIMRSSIRLNRTEMMLAVLTSCSHGRVAELCYDICKDNTRVVPINEEKNNNHNYMFYNFNAMRKCWEKSDETMELIMSSIGPIQREFERLKLLLLSKITDSDDYLKARKLFQRVDDRLHDTRFNEAVRKRLGQMLNRECKRNDPQRRHFGKLLDSSPSLLGCLNGVLVLDEDDRYYLREGRPEDNHSMNTGVAYRPLSEIPQSFKDNFNSFMSKFIVDPEERYYVLWVMAMCMNAETVTLLYLN